MKTRQKEEGKRREEKPRRSAWRSSGGMHGKNSRRSSHSERKDVTKKDPSTELLEEIEDAAFADPKRR